MIGRCLLVLLCCLPGTRLVAAPPVQAFTNFPKFETLKISPDGKHLALTQRLPEHEALTVLTFPELKAVSQQHFGNQMDVGDLSWSSPSRLLISPQRHILGFRAGKYYTGELIGVDIDGKPAELLFGYRAGKEQTGTLIEQRKSIPMAARLLRRLPDRPGEALIQTFGEGSESTTSTAYRINVRTGALTKIIGSPLVNGRFLLDAENRPRLVYGANHQGDQEIYLRGVNGGEWRLVSTTPVMKGELFPLGTGASPDEFLAVERFGTADDGLVAWNAATGEKRILLRDPSVDVDDVSIDDLGRPWLVGYTKHFPEYWYPDPQHPYAIVHQLLRNTYKEHEISITSATDDKSLVVARVSAARMPALFLVVDARNRRILQRLPSNPDLKPEDLSQVDPFEFTARDGLRIDGYLTTPAGSSGKKLPMVVLVHGGPHGVKDDYGYDFERQLFASRGYAVLQVNYRGSSGRGAAFERSGYGRWGREMQDDVTDGVKWAISDGVADPKRICIYGGSYGAYAALTGAFREQGLFRCAIGMAGVYDLSLLFERGDIKSRQSGLNYLKVAVGTDKEELRRRSPLFNTDAIKIPVLLIHGRDDERAPLEHATRLRDALTRAGNPPEWLAEWEEGHGFAEESNRARAYTAMLDFLHRQIGGAPP